MFIRLYYPQIVSIVVLKKKYLVVETRIRLLSKLGDSNLSEKSDLATLVECLTGMVVRHDKVMWTYWEDFTCLDVTQCLLNKTILNVAAKYIDSDISGCLGSFLALGTKHFVLGKHVVWKASEDDTFINSGVPRGRTLHSLFQKISFFKQEAAYLDCFLIMFDLDASMMDFLEQGLRILVAFHFTQALALCCALRLSYRRLLRLRNVDQFCLVPETLSRSSLNVIFLHHIMWHMSFKAITYVLLYLLQLLLDFFSFSAASFSALARYPVSEDKELIVIVERFILEQLNIAKDSISEVKKLMKLLISYPSIINRRAVFPSNKEALITNRWGSDILLCQYIQITLVGIDEVEEARDARLKDCFMETVSRRFKCALTRK
ncbi:hypothetical protein CK203_043899 [Vitis vinifera]|uniref:Uncharacterized protein n=1 Tax=Vitis vinifera TaxID=29760 RepID=A0A438HVP4_VITVI|nr:hypothetical protein CK203_043899 [Vitis vinifera]